MLPTLSPNYDDIIRSLGRSTQALLILDFLRAEQFTSATITATSEFDATTPAYQVGLGRVNYGKYSSVGLDPNYENEHKGWQSGIFADAAGLISPQTVTITYPAPVVAQNFWWVADRIYHPVDFIVEININGVWETLATVVGHGSDEWALRTAGPQYFSAIRITISKVTPANGNARLLTFGPVYRLVMDSDEIMDFGIIEDIYTDSSGAVGQLTANYLDAAVDNSRKWFTPTVETSPFYQLLVPQLKLRCFAGVEVNTDEYEFVPLGTFYTGQWSTPSITTEARFNAYDRMKTLMDMPTPMLPTFLSTSAQQLVRYLFNTIGLKEDIDYTIDPGIDVPILMGWCPQDNVGETIQELSEAGNLYMNVSRYNVIEVKSYIQSNVPVATYTDDDLILNADNPHLYREVCTSFNMAVHWASLDDITSVGKIEDITLNAGESQTYYDIRFSSIPLAELTNIRILGAGDIVLSEIDHGAKAITLTVKNVGVSQQTFTVEFLGRVVKQTPNTITKYNSNLWGEKTLNITNPLIQDPFYAERYAESLSNFLGDSQRRFIVNWRVDPTLQLGDSINLIDNTDGIVGSDLVVTAMNIKYDGGFSGELVAYKKMQ
jgi:hypothetical protein